MSVREGAPDAPWFVDQDNGHDWWVRSRDESLSIRRRFQGPLTEAEARAVCGALNAVARGAVPGEPDFTDTAHGAACIVAVEKIAHRLGLEIVNEASKVRPQSMSYVKPSELTECVPVGAVPVDAVPDGPWRASKDDDDCWFIRRGADKKADAYLYGVLPDDEALAVRNALNRVAAARPALPTPSNRAIRLPIGMRCDMQGPVGRCRLVSDHTGEHEFEEPA